ncbi:MAG: DUF2752 domain-containing protein [bacterium]|nr:DUF2752 domain-containing protein [bacterium]
MKYSGPFRLAPLAPRGLDHELIWGALCLAAFATAWSFPYWKPFFPSSCLFRLATGCPCPLCGGTHAAAALAHGAWGEAWRFNPLAAAGAAGAGVYVAYAAMAVLANRRVRATRPLGRAAGWAMRFATGAVVAANWLYLLLAGR